jgi:D-alanyl-D-alanine dipeptidase
LTGTLIFLLILYNTDLSYITKECAAPAGNETVTVLAIPTSSATSAAPDQTLKSSDPAQNSIALGESNAKPSSEQTQSKKSPHEGFIYLTDFLPEARLEVRYATKHNFTGQVVDGYTSDRICCTIEAAEALKKASQVLKEKGFGLLIYDAYRPKRAVSFFIEWGKQPENNLTKAEFYPNINKKDLFSQGYLARRSAHSRGSAIDLTLFDLKTGALLDMGSPFDLLDPVSNHGTKLITEAQTKNRNILKDVMKSSGFKELRTEWWHYQLIDEPYPETYFDFVIE